MRIPIDVTRTILRTLLVCFCLLAPAAAAFAQETPPAPSRAAFALPKENPLTAWNKYMYGQLFNIVLRSADKMPEANYSFKPTDTVRSYGQILGHVADAQYLFCSIAMGEKNPAPKIEQTKTSKADITAALKDAFAYCDGVYAALTDAAGAQTIDITQESGRQTRSLRMGLLTLNYGHNNEIYGSMVVYLRMKNLVPPASEPRGPQKK